MPSTPSYWWPESLFKNRTNYHIQQELFGCNLTDCPNIFYTWPNNIFRPLLLPCLITHLYVTNILHSTMTPTMTILRLDCQPMYSGSYPANIEIKELIVIM